MPPRTQSVTVMMSMEERDTKAFLEKEMNPDFIMRLVLSQNMIIFYTLNGISADLVVANDSAILHGNDPLAYRLNHSLVVSG